MNVATIGTSNITKKFIEAVHESQKLTLVGVYSRSEEKARLFGTPLIFTNLDELANSKHVDIVYIASPNSLHFHQAIHLMKHKKHIICEKPMFSNSHEFIEAYKVADKYGVFLFEAFRNIYTPNFNILKDNIHRTGPVRHSFFHFMKYSSRYDKVLAGEEPNIFSPRFSGGALVDLGVYPISLAVALFGEPDQISTHVVMLPTLTDGSGTIVLQYPGHVCTLMFSKITNTSLGSEISGESGLVKLDSIAPIRSIEYIDRHTNNTTQLAVEEYNNDMIYEIDKMVSIIESNDQNKYNEVRNISSTVVGITEKAREACNIHYIDL